MKNQHESEFGKLGQEIVLSFHFPFFFLSQFTTQCVLFILNFVISITADIKMKHKLKRETYFDHNHVL